MIEENLKKIEAFGKTFDKKSNSKQTQVVSSIGVIVNIIWLVSAFLQPPLDTLTFVSIGFISLILTTIARIFTALKSNSQFSEIEGGGSIVGFVLACVIANYIYPLSTDSVIILEIQKNVDYIIQVYLFFVFLIWFIIPTFRNSQEIVFGLPPIISYFILNFWKLLILSKFLLVMLPEFNSINPTLNAFILLFAYFELILLLLRQRRINIIDIILDVQQIFTEIFRGPGQALKWSFIIIFFLIFRMVDADIFMLSVIAFSLIIGFISFTAMITRVGMNSGIFKSKLESGTALAPTIFNEISHIEPETIHQNFFQVTTPFTIKTKTKIHKFSNETTLFRIPLTLDEILCS